MTGTPPNRPDSEIELDSPEAPLFTHPEDKATLDQEKELEEFLRQFQGETPEWEDLELRPGDE